MPILLKKVRQTINVCVVNAMTLATVVLSLTVHAQALTGVESEVFDFCGLSRLLTQQERSQSSAVRLCAAHMNLVTKDCVEKEVVLDGVKDNLKRKPRAEYSLAQALADLATLSARLGVKGGCTPTPVPMRTVLDDPFNLRKDVR